MTYQTNFADRLKANAEWRREKAVDISDDRQRNLDAAVLSDQLAAAFTEDDFDEGLMARIVDLEQDEDTVSDLNLTISEVIGRLGFDEFPGSPDDLLDTVLRRFGE